MDVKHKKYFRAARKFYKLWVNMELSYTKQNRTKKKQYFVSYTDKFVKNKMFQYSNEPLTKLE